MAINYRSQTILHNDASTIPAGSYSYLEVDIAQASLLLVKLQIDFTVTAGGDIDFYVFDEYNYNMWKSGHASSPIVYKSRVTSYKGDVHLPNGKYYLVWDNSYSIITPKTLRQNVDITWLSINPFWLLII
jgi:hypothetical protein